MTISNVTRTLTITLPATLDQLHIVSDLIEDMLAEFDDIVEPEIVRYNIQLAVQEICVNIINHAYQGAPDEKIEVELTLRERPRHMEIILCDTGSIFDPLQAPEPDLSTVHEHGYGMFLAQALLDKLSYTRIEPHNRWHLAKYF